MEQRHEFEWRKIMSVQLLDKTRKINKLLHNNNSSKVVFNDICEVLTEILNSNILVVSRKGKVLGISKKEEIRPLTELINGEVGGHIDSMLNERLLSVLSTRKMSTSRHWDSMPKQRKATRRLYLRLRSRENGLELCLFTNRMKNMKLTILFSASMVQQ